MFAHLKIAGTLGARQLFLFSCLFLFVSAAWVDSALDRRFVRTANTLPSLHVEGTRIVTETGDDFIFRAINVDDYHEFGEAPWDPKCTTKECFEEILSWLTTKEDFKNIHDLGFNAVRVNLGYRHYDWKMDRIEDFVRWGTEYDLYVILAYMSPPGTNDEQYQQPFWRCIEQEGENCENLKTFLGHWQALVDRVGGYSNVLYELLNEPKIGPDDIIDSRDPAKLYLYVDLIRRVVSILKSKSDNHPLIVGGMDYSVTQVSEFKIPLPSPFKSYQARPQAPW